MIESPLPDGRWRIGFSEKEELKMANKVGQIYVCEICGNKVKMIVAGKGVLVCCGQPMKLVGEER